jgi:head-tail adaptor
MIIGNRQTNPGELRTPVTFYKRAITTGTGGFQKAGVGDKIADALVRWENAHGPEVWDAAAVNAESAATVLARYNSAVDGTCLVKKGSLYFEIVGDPDNIAERSEFMELKVKRYSAG